MIQLDANRRSARMLAAGRLTVTFRSPTGTHITITAKCRAPRENGQGWEGVALADAKVLFIEVPGADGGWADRVAKVTRSKGFVADPSADQARVWCARQLLRYVAGEALPVGLEVFEEDRCGRCGRALTDPVSIERGIGPECYGHETGSRHETKVKPASDGKDKQGVSYAVGNHRARSRRAKEELGGVDALLEKGIVPGASQLAGPLPGSTWEDIFAPVILARS